MQGIDFHNESPWSRYKKFSKPEQAYNAVQKVNRYIYNFFVVKSHKIGSGFYPFNTINL
jgi:hypothetical protein